MVELLLRGIWRVMMVLMSMGEPMNGDRFYAKIDRVVDR